MGAPVINDGHTHITSREHGSGRSAADLVAYMDAAGITRAAVVTPSTLGWDNAITFDAVAESPSRFVSIVRLNVRANDGLERLGEMIDRGAVGLRISLMGEDDLDWLNGDRMGEVASVLAGRAVAEFHCDPGQLAAVGAVAAAHPRLTVLVDHLGRPTPGEVCNTDHRVFVALAELPNVHAKTPNLSFFTRSGAPYDDLAPFVVAGLDAFGAHRIMWGADWPLCLEGGPYSLALEGILHALEGRSEREQADVLGGTFQRLFG